MKNIRLTTAVLAAVTVSTGVRAGDKWWLEPQTDGYWHTAANWGGTPAGLPTASTSVSVTRTRETAPVQILAGEAYVAKSLALSESNVGTQYCGHLQVAGAMTNSDFLTVGNAWNGLLRIVDGGSAVVTNGPVSVGAGAGIRGAVVMTNGWLGAAYFRIGDSGTGSLFQVGGTVTTPGSLTLAYAAGSGGTYTNIGGYLSLSNVFFCGNRGSGEYVQAGGTNALANWLSVGQETNSTGRYVLQAGVVTEAANQTFRIGKFGSGTLLFRSGTVNMGTGSKLVVREGESGTGVLRGWGDFAVADNTPYVVNNGLIVADGGGAASDLNLSDFIYATNSLANGANGTNGWYAVNKGRLRYPRAWLTAALPERGQGTAPFDANNDLVNSIRLSFTGIASEGYLRGELYAPDRDDIPAGVPSHNNGKIIGVWRLPTTVPFGTVRLRVRFDRTAVGPTDSVRLYRCDSAGKWSAVGTAAGTAEAVSTTAPLAPLPAGNGYLGWFAVVAFPNTGTLIRIN